MAFIGMVLAYFYIGLPIGKLPGDHLRVGDPQPVADLPPQVWMRGAGEYFYIRHSEIYFDLKQCSGCLRFLVSSGNTDPYPDITHLVATLRQNK